MGVSDRPWVQGVITDSGNVKTSLVTVIHKGSAPVTLRKINVLEIMHHVLNEKDQKLTCGE